MSARHAYFFKGSRYIRYNIDTDLVDVGPADIAQFWTHLPGEFQGDLDAVVNWGNGHAYLFKGSRYLRYNIGTDLVDVGPADIAEFWTHLPAEFQSDLDTVVNWGDGRAYFFKGSRYIRYNIDTDLVDVGPADISQFWTHLPAEFQSNLDAAVNWGEGHTYFFKGTRYVRYNIDTDLVDVGPAEIAQFWTHLPAEFQGSLSDVVNWDLRLHWEAVDADQRFGYAMARLIERYGYPANGAAGLVGNLAAESGVIPTRIEGSLTGTPMRAKNFQGQITDFTAEEIRDRNGTTRLGPALPGVGLAQWTSDLRRLGLFAHSFAGAALGVRVLFNMEGQIDYLVHELKSKFGGVQGILVNPSVALNDASDEVVYNFEVPQAVLQGGTKLSRSDPRVQQVFIQRRRLSQQALNAYQNGAQT